MLFGPFGVSLAPQIRASRILSRIFTPLAQSFARISGHRQLGLKYDDLCEYYATHRATYLKPSLIFP